MGATRCDIIQLMNKRVFRTISYILVCAAVAFSLTGCEIVPSLDLTEEQSTLIAEYAAGKLIEYAKGHPGGLMTVEDIDLTEVNPGMKKEEPPMEEPALPGQLIPAGQDTPLEPGPPEEGPEIDPDQEALVDVPEDISAAPTQSIAQALGLNGPELKYDYYETTHTYPENDAELAFSMKAAEGKELLIVHFALTNPGDGDVDVRTNSTDFKVRMLINGKDKVRGDVTFLDNDLMNYNGTLTPGAEVDAVLVFEVMEDTEISSMDLIVIGNEGEQNYHII